MLCPFPAFHFLPSWGPDRGVRPQLLLKALALSGSRSPQARPFPAVCCQCSCLLRMPPSYFLLDDVQAPHNSGSGMGLCGGSHAPVTGFLTGNAQCLFGLYRKQHSGCGLTNAFFQFYFERFIQKPISEARLSWHTLWEAGAGGLPQTILGSL